MSNKGKKAMYNVVMYDYLGSTLGTDVNAFKEAKQIEADWSIHLCDGQLPLGSIYQEKTKGGKYARKIVIKKFFN